MPLLKTVRDRSAPARRAGRDADVRLGAAAGGL